MRTFERQIELPVTPTEAFGWHARPGALRRLLPPWEPATVRQTSNSLEPGARVVLGMRLGPLPLTWVAEHTRYEPPSLFEDVQRRGPFARWRHRHHFEPSATGALLRDAIEWSVPLGRALDGLARPFVEQRLAAMFRYRHATTLADLALHADLAVAPRTVAITGAGGLLGATLAAMLTTGGHRVIRLVRRTPVGPDEARWDPAAGLADPEALSGVDVVVHLAGASVARRWTAEHKDRIRRSRVEGTRALVASLRTMGAPPPSFVCASAVGWYGADRPEEQDEAAPAADDFLAEVVQGWEAAALEASDFARVVCLRFGALLSPAGGMLQRLRTPFGLGLGGRVGAGTQSVAWIGLDDAAEVACRAAFDDRYRGPINVVAPEQVSQQAFARTLGRVLRRPTLLPLPAAVVRALFGEMGEIMLLGGARVRPARLEALGYRFRHPTLEAALRHALGAAAR